MNWRKLKVGQKVAWMGEEWSKVIFCIGVVTKVFDDHAIVEAEGMTLWVDDITGELFREVR